MATYQLRPMSLGDILDTAAGVYRRYLGTLTSVAIVCLGLPTAASIYLQARGGVLLHPWLVLALTLLQGLGSVVCAGAVVWVVSEGYLGRDPTAQEAIAQAFDRFGQIFVSGFAKYLVTALACLLLIVPGIIVACGYAVTVQTVMLESLDSGTDALGRSWALTKGFKGKAFLIGLVVFLLISIPEMAAGVLAALMPASREMFAVTASLLQIILLPVMACALTLFYYDLRVRKEAFDLEQLSAQLGGVVAPARA